MSAATPAQMRTLRLLAAGVRLKPVDLPHVGAVLLMTPGHRAIGRVQQRTVMAMVDAGFIEGQADGFFHLTEHGRDLTEIKVHVRAYAKDLRDAAAGES